MTDRRVSLLQAEAFGHEALEAGFVEEVVGEFFVGEHGEGRTLGAGGEFRGFFDGEAGVLADDRGDHAHHDLETADAAGFVLGILSLGFIDRQKWILFTFRRFPSIHASPFSARNSLATELDVAAQRDVAPVFPVLCASLQGKQTARRCWVQIMS